MTIYVVTDRKSFGGKLDVSYYANHVAKYDGHYLYKQTYSDSENEPMTLNHETFVKVVDDEWMQHHGLYYGQAVYDDVNADKYGDTDYDKFQAKLMQKEF